MTNLDKKIENLSIQINELDYEYMSAHRSRCRDIEDQLDRLVNKRNILRKQRSREIRDV